jgi:NADP-dependent 3-hydroxy acid dehydrogenase YdfG
VLATEGGRGLGRAMAERGASVAIAGRTVSQMNQTARALKATGASAYVFVVDHYDVAQAEGLLARAVESMGGLDILVNNAGGWGSTVGAVGLILEATIDGSMPCTT